MPLDRSCRRAYLIWVKRIVLKVEAQDRTMKTAFQEYFRLSEDDYKDLWDHALVVLDANVLLNFYRYPASVCESLYEVLGQVKRRLWLPHQVVQDFLQNRESVII